MMKQSFLFAMLLLFSSCSTVSNKLEEYLCSNKGSDLIRKLKGSSLSKRGTFYAFTVHRESKENRYQFAQDESTDQWKLISTDLEFDTTGGGSGPLFIKNGYSVEQWINYLVPIIESLDVRGYSSDFEEFGIQLKFYTKDERAVLIVEDLSLVKDEEYNEYLSLFWSSCERVYVKEGWD